MGKMKDALIEKQEALAEQYGIPFEAVQYIYLRYSDDFSVERVFKDPKLMHIVLAAWHVEEALYESIDNE